MDALEELLNELNNWFERDGGGKPMPRLHGRFEVKGGAIELPEGFLAEGQLFRVLGSAMNDGLHQWPATGMVDESFEGHVHALAVPKAVKQLAADIDEWKAQNGKAEVSPYQSESFGGYSYTLKGGGNDGAPTWRSAFAARMRPWRKL